MAENEPILWVSLAVMLVGLLGSVLPALPVVPLIFVSALVYAYLTDFEVVGARPRHGSVTHYRTVGGGSPAGVSGNLFCADPSPG